MWFIGRDSTRFVSWDKLIEKDNSKPECPDSNCSIGFEWIKNLMDPVGNQSSGPDSFDMVCDESKTTRTICHQDDA